MNVKTLLIASALFASVVGFAPAQQAQAQNTTLVCTQSYTVQRGDTLYRIARRYNTTVANLQTINNLANPNRINAGQTLCVAQSQQMQRTHTVRRGDTLTSIARAYGVDMQVLAELNGITNVNRITVGQVLIIPDVTIQIGQ